MNINQFKQQVKPFRERVYDLLNRKGESPLPQQDLLTEYFDEFYIALEELEVAEQELCQQSEELHQQNLELAIERQRYQDLFEFAPDGYVLTDANGTIREANRAAATLLNVRQRFLVGKPLYIFFTKEVRHEFLSKLIQLRQIDRLQEWEVTLSPRKGDPIDAAVSVVVVRNWEGEPVTLCWLLRDITSRKRASEALLRAKVAEAARVELEKEISERKRVGSQLLNNAFHDALTGLPNRALFMKRLERAIEYGLRHKDYLFAVLFLDLDGFKVINDSLGHIFGDQLLIAIASRLPTCLRPTDITARLGGDELTVLLEGINDISDAIKVAERIQAELKLPFILGEQEVFTTASIGIALSATGYSRPSDLLRDADIAMYRAKSQGKARYEIFNKDMHI